MSQLAEKEKFRRIHAVPARTIIDVMSGTFKSRRNLVCDGWKSDVPQTLYDMTVCTNLLRCQPEWRENLDNMGRIFPRWKPFVKNWEKLETLMNKALDNTKYLDRFNSLLKQLKDEGMAAEGWVRDDCGGWRKEFEPERAV